MGAKKAPPLEPHRGLGQLQVAEILKFELLGPPDEQALGASPALILVSGA